MSSCFVFGFATMYNFTQEFFCMLTIHTHCSLCRLCSSFSGSGYCSSDTSFCYLHLDFYPNTSSFCSDMKYGYSYNSLMCPCLCALSMRKTSTPPAVNWQKAGRLTPVRSFRFFFRTSLCIMLTCTRSTVTSELHGHHRVTTNNIGHTGSCPCGN